MSKTIMITGGTGYIGAWIVKMLLEKSYTVRMTVRNKAKKEKYEKLEQLQEQLPGKLEIWEADLLKEGSYDGAAKGADAIIHVASPFILRFKDAKKDLLDPALLGTRNVLNAATRSGTVKKVVLTSSVAAVFGDNIDMAEQGLNEFTEQHFNTTSSAKHQPYSYSKIIAEKEAWSIAKQQNSWKLVVINPSFVLGPALNGSSDSESLNFMKDILKGRFFFGAPDLMFGFVDVRDVARAHIVALEKEDADGRHILAVKTMSIMDLTNMMKKMYGSKYKLPLMKAPKPLLMLIGGLFGVTPKFVKRNVGHKIRLNTTRSTEKLGLQYRNMEETILEMVEQMHKQKLV
ncbi:MAG: NAD-dependent epimerase/dehydratase family protein [Bacteroidetes bacterium]|nr:MAG: NAD-dependent epimerase/dehydratase family protein [Bacteroidota bacterium]